MRIIIPAELQNFFYTKFHKVEAVPYTVNKNVKEDTENVERSTEEHTKNIEGHAKGSNKLDTEIPMPTGQKTSSKDDEGRWESTKEHNPLVQKHTVTRYYRCLEHPEVKLPNGGTAQMHFTRTHGINLNGSKYVPELKDKEINTSSQKDGSRQDENIQTPPSSETSPASEQPQGDLLTQKIEEVLAKRGLGSGQGSSLFVPEDAVLENISKDIANGATAIAKNIDIQYLYYKTKTIFPREWTFELWVAFCIAQTLENWGVHVTTYQDLERLSDKQLFAMKEAREEWIRNGQGK